MSGYVRSQVRYIPIHPEYRQAIEAWPISISPKQKVFTGNQQQWTNRFRRLCERLGFKGHPHMLRHTFASYLVMGGTDLSTVQKMMGHHSIKVTEKYAHLAPDHMKTAIGKLDYSVGISEKAEHIWNMG